MHTFACSMWSKLLLTFLPDGVQNKCIHLLSGCRPCPKSLLSCACKDTSSDRGATIVVPTWSSVRYAIIILQDTYEFFSDKIDELSGDMMWTTILHTLVFYGCTTFCHSTWNNIIFYFLYLLEGRGTFNLDPVSTVLEIAGIPFFLVYGFSKHVS